MPSRWEGLDRSYYRSKRYYLDPDCCWTRAGVVEHIVRPAVAVKIRCSHQFPATAKSRPISTPNKRRPGQIPDSCSICDGIEPTKQIPYAFNTLGHGVRVGVRGNVDVGVAVGLDVCVGLAVGLSDGVSVTVVVGVGVGPGVAAAGSTVYRSVSELELAPLPNRNQRHRG
jgi:hypothetical protein